LLTGKKKKTGPIQKVRKTENNPAWIVFLVIPALLFAGCIGNALVLQKQHGLKYSLAQGDQLTYEITSDSANKDTTVKWGLEMDVTNTSDTFLNLKIIPGNVDQQPPESPYTLTITPYGNVITTSFSGPVAREIQPEFPNGLKYPEKPVRFGEVWTEPVAYSGTYPTKDGIVEYSVTGDSRYTWFDQKTVPVSAGKFQCIGVKQDVNFTLVEKIVTGNNTIYTTSEGKINGENWIDQDKGFLVLSRYSVKKTLKADISDVMKTAGFAEFHREIPSDSTISCELMNVKN
jgi:hypothetical protein